MFDIDHERSRAAAGQWGVDRVAASLEELVSGKDVDVVIVSNPPGAHEQSVVAALEAGKHVLCASARLRCSPAYKTARRMRDAGELGEVYHARFSSWNLRGRSGSDAVNRWRLDRSLAGGGQPANFGVCLIDPVLWRWGIRTWCR